MLIVIIALIVLIFILSGQNYNNTPKKTWVKNREDIVNEIRSLGACYSQILLDGWVRYLS